MSDEKNSLVAELHIQALGETSCALHRELIDSANLLGEAIRDFTFAPSWGTLRKVNSLWARGWRHLEESRASKGGAA